MKFYVTGFGPFSGVPHNPTQAVVELLEAQRSGLQVPYEFETAVLEVAAAPPVRDYVKELFASERLAAAAARGPVVVLHLGVDCKGCQFKLEQQAANEATFRCPDQSGWQPQRQLVDDHPGLTLASRLLTDLDVGGLADQLATRGRHDVAVSVDAGRFVCNYTYYLSLLRSELARRRHGAPLHALFVHVPPLSVAPLDDHYSFLLGLLAALAAALTPTDAAEAAEAAAADVAEGGTAVVSAAACEHAAAGSSSVAAMQGAAAEGPRVALAAAATT